MTDRSIREASSEAADPFGDFPESQREAGTRTVPVPQEAAVPQDDDELVSWSDYRSAGATTWAPAPPPESDNYPPPEGFEPEPSPRVGGGSGGGMFTYNQGFAHVLDACYLALGSSGHDVALGSHHAYEQDGSDQLVRFRGTDNSEWSCRISTFGTTTVEDVRLAP